MRPPFEPHDNDAHLKWVFGPLAFICLVGAISSATVNGAVGVFATLAFTSIGLGLSLVTFRAMRDRDAFAPVRSELLMAAHSFSVGEGPIGPAPSRAAPPSTWSIELIQSLTPQRFEVLCLAYFRGLGFRATARSFGPNGGVDIRLHAPNDPKSLVNLVHCRSHKKPIGVQEVRELVGAMSVNGVPRGIFVAARGFQVSAREYAQANRIFLMSAEELLAKILERPADEQSTLLNLATQIDNVRPAPHPGRRDMRQ